MRILFIGFDYYGYTSAINDEFGNMGFKSYFHDIQPRTLNYKVIRRLNTNLYQNTLDKYHKSIIDSYDPNFFDHIVFLQVHQMSNINMVDLRSRQKDATFTLYNWDSIATHDYRPYLKYFDRAFTFDPLDAEALSINYLPLFATNRYHNIDRSRYDPASVYFIGNIVNPERYRVVREFEDFCAKHGLQFDFFMSTTIHGWSEMRRNGIRPRDVSLRHLPTDRQDEWIARSAAVFDFANHAQSGFTMRVMENLCAGKKIITNNHNVKNAPFYSEDRFLIYNETDFSAVPDFLARPLYEPLASFSEYKVNNFAARLIGVQQ